MNQLIDNMMHTNYQHCFFHQCHSSNAYIYIAALCTRFVLVREMVQLGKLCFMWVQCGLNCVCICVLVFEYASVCSITVYVHVCLC